MLDPRELAADKMLALVARVVPRDYIDLEAIAQRYDIRDVIRWAEDKDGGFALWQLQDALRRFDRISPDRFELDQDSYQQLRAFVHDLHRFI